MAGEKRERETMKKKPLKERIEAITDCYNRERAVELLPSLKKAIGGENGKIYAMVESVSRSGMSRTIVLFIIHKGELVNLNNTAFAKVYGDSISGYGTVRIHGCGMDMLFEATYRLYRWLFDQRRKPYQRHLNRYQQI